MQIETVTLYSGDDEFIVNADEVSQYMKLGLTKKKGGSGKKGNNTVNSDDDLNKDPNKDLNIDGGQNPNPGNP